MKHITCRIALALLLISIGTLKAQSFGKGQTDLNIGIGLGNTIIGPGDYNSTPPLSISLGYGITRDISIGGYLGFTSASYRYSGWEDYGHGNNGYYTDTYKWSYVIVGFQADYHFARFIPNEKVDLYAGLLLGNDFAHSSYYTNSPYPEHVAYSEQSYGGVVLSLHAGIRYHLTNHFGLFAELGYGITYLNVGVNFKF
jgi:hypothetical protein